MGWWAYLSNNDWQSCYYFGISPVVAGTSPWTKAKHGKARIGSHLWRFRWEPVRVKLVRIGKNFRIVAYDVDCGKDDNSGRDQVTSQPLVPVFNVVKYIHILIKNLALLLSCTSTNREKYIHYVWIISLVLSCTWCSGSKRCQPRKSQGLVYNLPCVNQLAHFIRGGKVPEYKHLKWISIIGSTLTLPCRIQA